MVYCLFHLGLRRYGATVTGNLQTFSAMMNFTLIWAGGGQPGDDFKPRLNTWLRDAHLTVAENIGRFEQGEKWNELAKWVWFRKHLNQALESYPSPLLDTMFD